MNRLHSFALYALVTPALTLGSGSVLAERSASQDRDRDQQSIQHEHGAQSTSRSGETQSQAASSRKNTGDQHRGYIDGIPANGAQVSNLMGANVRATGDNNVGSVEDLIIDENGQIVAIVVSVGGFLGIGQKDVAIGWDHVTRSGTADEQELRIDVKHESLRDAPEFKTQ